MVNHSGLYIRLHVEFCLKNGCLAYNPTESLRTKSHDPSSRLLT